MSGPQSAPYVGMSEKNTIQDLLADEVKDLYSAEKQLIKAIPKMAKGSDVFRSPERNRGPGDTA